jgi:hypothetical protein
MRNGTIRQRNGHYFPRIYVGKKQRQLAPGSLWAERIMETIDRGVRKSEA